MVKMRSNIDGHEFEASDDEAYQLQAAGKAHSVEDAERKAKAIEQGNFNSVTGRPDPGVPEAPESLSAPGAPGQHASDAERAEEPVRQSNSGRKR